MRKQSVPDAVDGAVLHVQADDADAAVVLHDEVQREVLDEVGGVEGQRAAVEGVEHGVAGAVGGGGAAVGLATCMIKTVSVRSIRTQTT
jgi:hypothetical protein